MHAYNNNFGKHQGYREYFMKLKIINKFQIFQTDSFINIIFIALIIKKYY